MSDISAITAIVQDLGVWAFFAFMFIEERKQHRLTIERWQSDLREIAGFRSGLPSKRYAVDEPATQPPPPPVG